MDLITLALAKKYTDEKAGYSEQNVFTFDGNTDGKLVVNNMVRVSTKKIDATTAVSVTGMAGGVEQTIEKENMTIEDGVLSFQGLCFVLCSNGEDEEYPVGVYVLATEEMYVSRVEFAETIHTIDPKFIPGAVLPVVELSTYPMPDGAPLTAEENAKLDALEGMPCILKCTVFDGSQTIPFQIVASSFVYGNQLNYMAISSLGELAINRESAGWIFFVTQG